MQSPIASSQLGLGPCHLGTNAAVPCDNSRFNALQTAMESIRAVLAFEDRFAMVVDNLMELELHLFQWTMLYMLRSKASIDQIFTYKRDVNRHLSNLLSTCRQYIDQTHHEVQPLLDGTTTSTQAAFSAQYDAHLAYRVMEALRNYMQHRGLGAHAVSLNGSWLGTPGQSGRRYVTSLSLDLEHLAKSKKFKTTVLTELEELDSVPDLKLFIRSYVSALATTHDQLRGALHTSVDAWRSEIVTAFEDVQTAYPKENLHVLTVFKQRADSTRKKLLDVSRKQTERLEVMRRLNQTTLNLGPAYASSEALEHKPKKT